jgi:hypothetical protein
MTHEITPEVSEYSRAEIMAICERKNAITERLRSVDPVAALEAPETVDPDVFWAALALAAGRKDLFDGLAHVRMFHEATPVRVDALACLLAADPVLVAELGVRVDAAIAERRHDEVFLVWAHACVDDDTWELLRVARHQLGSR